ncbi:MAG: hypothetical protein AB7L09_00750 [Nitrospira sp.]
MTKKIEPSVLDQLFNIVVSDREVKQLLAQQSAALVEGLFNEEYSESAARKILSEKLTAFMAERGLSGRGRKKMVDKAVAKALKGYRSRLYLKLMHDAKELRADGQNHAADRLFADLAAGRIGKERSQPWYRRYR